jgi:hypothetical protein
MEEIRYMGRFEATLPGEKSAGCQSTIDSASDLKAESLMKLGGIHLWIFVLELNLSTGEFAHRKPTGAYSRGFRW